LFNESIQNINISLEKKQAKAREILNVLLPKNKFDFEKFLRPNY
jgi:hypothetical protein